MADTFGHNSVDPKQIGSFISEIDAADDELRSMQSAYMTKCKKPRKKIREAMAAAKAAGLDMPAFRALVERHRGELKADRREAKLEPGEVESLRGLRAALGDFGATDLGRAAVERAERRAAALDSLSA